MICQNPMNQGVGWSYLGSFRSIASKPTPGLKRGVLLYHIQWPHPDSIDVTLWGPYMANSKLSPSNTCWLLLIGCYLLLVACWWWSRLFLPMKPWELPDWRTSIIPTIHILSCFGYLSSLTPTSISEDYTKKLIIWHMQSHFRWLGVGIRNGPLHHFAYGKLSYEVTRFPHSRIPAVDALLVLGKPQSNFSYRNFLWHSEAGIIMIISFVTIWVFAKR